MKTRVKTFVSAAAIGLAAMAFTAVAQQPQNVIPAPQVAAPPPPPRPACSECGVVRGVRLVEEKGGSSGGGAVVGGVLGGVLGHQIGSGRGNTAATVGGALLGGLIGNRVHQDRADNGDYDMGRCRVLAANGSSPAGYDVRYEYHGQEYVARLDHDPGRFVKLGRDVNSDGVPYDSSGTSPRSPYYSGG